jgi:tight adherence protein B
MNYLVSHDWVMIPVFGILVFIITYLWSDRILGWLHRKSLGQREEVLRLLALMFVQTDRKKVTLMMLSGSFGFGIFFFLLLWPNVIMGLVVGSIVTILMWSVPKLIVQSRYEKRCNKFVDQMIDGMTIMANGTRSGLSVQQCMERIQENLDNPISQEFGLVLTEIRVGRGMQDALNELGMRIPRPDVQMFVTAVNILTETGGKMAETFTTIVYTIRERHKVEKKIEALTAQGLTQGMIITAVPFFLLAVFLIVDPGYVMPLFTTTLGLIALIVMLALQGIGGFLMLKIVKINV